MKRSISLIVLILVFATGIIWAETEKEWLKKGHKATEAENYDEAIKCYKEAITINPNSALAHYNLGDAYYDKEMFDEAIVEYKKSLVIDPDNKAAHLILGNTYKKKGMLDDAVSEYKKVIDIDSNNAWAHQELGIVYAMKGLNSKAAEHFYRAGLLFLKQGDKDTAMKSYVGLKGTKSVELERALFKELYPDYKMN